MDIDVAPALPQHQAAPTPTPTLASVPPVTAPAPATQRLRASAQNGTYPRPQLVRDNWVDLGGRWTMQFDDDGVGLDDGWQHSNGFGRDIRVPFPFESPASGIGESDFHPVVWYRTTIDAPTLTAAGAGRRTILHFGAVDYSASVWLNGTLLGHHEGGSTPFHFDATHALVAGEQTLVVRAFDDPLDVAQPRGKQDWQREPHSIWYHRTTGIWQPVWLETVNDLSVEHLAWTTDLTTGTVSVQVELSRRPDAETDVAVDLWFGEEHLGAVTVRTTSDRLEASISLSRQANGQDYEQLLWSHEHPRLVDARVTVSTAGSEVGSEGGSAPAEVIDTVYSYLGLRSVAVERGVFLLNDRPFYLRSVLNQGYWAQSHLAAPDAGALEREVRLILDLGFNSARMHQKIEDPRFLFWADRLGLLLWEEMPSAYEFSPTAMRRVMREWADVIRRDSSHPSIVTWVPLNESWGVQHIAHSRQVQAYARALYHQTVALDPTRPVISNDGWEHMESDIWSIHDYEGSGRLVRDRYTDASAVAKLFDGIGPAGRRLRLTDEPSTGQAVMLTEFGGIKYDTSSTAEAWGYTVAESADDFGDRFRALLDAVHSSTVLAGFCYTQLADTGQEVNGIVTVDREPKLPIDQLRAIILGAESDEVLPPTS